MKGIKRRVRQCPVCGYRFKNFRWRKYWKNMDVDMAAACPSCGTFAIEWPHKEKP